MYWTCCDRLLRSPCEQSTPAACYRRQLLVADPLTYCWWLKSCTWYVWNLVNNWVQAVSIKLVQVLSYQQWQLLDVSRHKCLFANKHVKCLNCWIQWEMVNSGYWSQLSNCFCQSSDGVDWCLLRCIWGGENLWVCFLGRGQQEKLLSRSSVEFHAWQSENGQSWECTYAWLWQWHL